MGIQSDLQKVSVLLAIKNLRIEGQYLKWDCPSLLAKLFIHAGGPSVHEVRLPLGENLDSAKITELVNSYQHYAFLRH